MLRYRSSVEYFFPKGADLDKSPITLVHDKLVQTVFFALDKAYGASLTEWPTDDADAKNVRVKNVRVQHAFFLH